MARPFYGHVSGPRDIVKINRKIRSEIRQTNSRAQLIELQKRSQYLYTLTFSPAWKTKFRGKIRKIRKVAKREFMKTRELVQKKLGSRSRRSRRSRGRGRR